MQRLSTALRWIFLPVIVLTCGFLSGSSFGETTGQFSVIIHPDGPLYVGDQVSFEVLAPPATRSEGHQVQVSLAGKALGSAGFAPYGISSRSEADLWWVWDTRQLQPGAYTLTFTSLPDDKKWAETIPLRPADRVPLPEPQAHWTKTTTVCCNIYTITGTDAARDIGTLERLHR
jgi:hypothetical protein